MVFSTSADATSQDTIKRGIAFRIGLIYGGLGLVWISASSFALWSHTLLPLPAVALDLAKGGAFVLGTAILLYVLVARWERALLSSKEDLLRASREVGDANTLLIAILRASQDVIAAWDADDRVVMFNPQFKHLFRCCRDRDIQVGMSFRQILRDGSDECRRCPDCCVRSLMNGHGTEPRPFTLGDRVEWYGLQHNSVTGSGGEPLGSLLIGRNVTEQVAAEQRQRDHEDALVSAVDHLTYLNRELQRFAFISSHDLQEPVRTVAWFARLLERHYGSSLDHIGQEYLAATVAAATRLHQMINDLLVLSQVEARSEMFGVVSAARACRSAVDSLGPVISERNAQVTLADLPMVWADTEQLVQLFRHLICNAVKFHRPGETPSVQVTATEHDGRWIFSVTDNGIGFSPDEQDVFELFRRLHPHDGYAGTGIGLAICKRIVEHHNGRIWAESRPGKGSVFRFTIPMWLPSGDPTPGQLWPATADGDNDGNR